MTHEVYKEMLPAHALSALDSSEALQLEEHLASCAACRDELKNWRSIAAGLIFATTASEPSPHLRQRVLEQVGEQDGISSHARKRDPGERRESSLVAPVAPPGANVWRSIGSLGAMAAGIASIALVVSLIVLWRENRGAQRELARLSIQVQAAQEQLAREREAVELLNSPGARIAELTATTMAPGAHAMLAYDANGRAMLLARGLPTAPSGKAYQLWFIVGNRPVPGKVFTTDAAGNGSLRDQLPATAFGSAIFAVTLEPVSGEKAPTSPIYLTSGS